MPWVKGQSGNPGGRPKGLTAVTEAARKRTVRAIKTLTEIMEKGENENARVRAAEALLERGWGKPAQPLTGEGGEGPVQLGIQIYLPDNGRGDVPKGGE